MLWISSTVLLSHVIIKSAGLLFVEAEILRYGNENILDSLQEGVIILSEDTNEMYYQNRAARNISLNFINSFIDFADDSAKKETHFANLFFKKMN